MSAVFSTISGFFIPAIIIVILSYGLYKKTPLYDVFIDGAKDGLKTVVEIIPFILAVFVGITALTSSGVMDWLQKISAPLFNMRYAFHVGIIGYIVSILASVYICMII